MPRSFITAGCMPCSPRALRSRSKSSKTATKLPGGSVSRSRGSWRSPLLVNQSKCKYRTSFHLTIPPNERNHWKKMTLLPEVEFHEDVRLLVYRPKGRLNKATVNKIVFIVEDLEAKSQEPFNRFFDTLRHDEVELNFRYVIQISLHRRRSYAGRPPVKSAILATDSTIIHYGRLHALLTQGSPINVRIFQEFDAAAGWLGVPIHLLQAQGASKKAET